MLVYTKLCDVHIVLDWLLCLKGVVYGVNGRFAPARDPDHITLASSDLVLNSENKAWLSPPCTHNFNKC